MIQRFWLFLLLVGVSYGTPFHYLHSTTQNEVCGSATFICFHEQIESVNWVIHNLINSFAQELNNSAASSWNFNIQMTDESITVLKLFNLDLDHDNMFNVTCEANGMKIGEAQPIQVQEINLTLTSQERDSVIFLNWTSTSSQQVTYCIEVWNNSLTGEMLDSVCGILMNETEFSYNRSWCSNYTFRVLLMNANCTGASSIKDYTDSLASLPPNIQSIPVSLSDRRVLIMSAPVCSCGLRFVDVDTEELITIEDTAVTISETTIAFHSQPLKDNRLYNVTVMAANAGGDSTSSSILSTHNIINITAGSPNTLQTSYTDTSESGGVLLALLHLIGGSVDFSKSAYLALSLNSSLNHTLSRNTVSSGEFRVLAYGINPDGDLGNDAVFPAVDMTTNVSTINGQVIAFKNVTQCNISAKSYEISVNCQDLRGYQVLVQSQNLSEIRRLKPGKSTDHQTPVKVEVEKTGTYRVAVFPVTSESGIVGSKMVYSSDVLIVNSGAPQSRAHVELVATVLAAILILHHQSIVL